MLACSLVTRTWLKTTRGLISGTFRRLTLEVLSPEKTFALLFENYLNDFTSWLVWNERMLAYWTQVSDRCPLGYLYFDSLVSTILISVIWRRFISLNSLRKWGILCIQAHVCFSSFIMSSFTTVDASHCSYSLLVGPRGDIRVVSLMVNGYAPRTSTRVIDKNIWEHIQCQIKTVSSSWGYNYFAYLCCRPNQHCPQWLSVRRLWLSKLRAITVNVTVGIVFCVDWHDSYTWPSTMYPANTCKDFMRLYEDTGWSESSLGLLVIL